MCKMLLKKNKIITAAAGSGKTSYIVEQALAVSTKKVLITTYTNENLEQINSYLIKKNGHIPKNITILSWYAFLLQEGVRPYQTSITERGRTISIYFEEGKKSISFVSKTNIDNYFD